MRTHHVALRPTPENFDKALHFYTELLGFQTLAKWEAMRNGKMTQHALIHPGDDVCIELFGMGADEAPGLGAWQHVCFETEDVDALVETLVEAGYQTTDPAGNPIPFEKGKSIRICEDPSMLWRCSFILGPCGELIEFMQDLEKTGE